MRADNYTGVCLRADNYTGVCLRADILGLSEY